MLFIWYKTCLINRAVAEFCRLTPFLTSNMPMNTTEALGHFFLDTREDLNRFFYRRLNSRDTADDLTQETYLRLLSSEQRIPTENRRALVFAIAGNLVVDHVRKQHNYARYITSHDDALVQLELIPCNDPGSEHKAIVWEDLERLHEVLQEVPDDSRTALYLSAINGLTYAQIGDFLGVSERMVAKRIANTLKYCRNRCNEC